MRQLYGYIGGAVDTHVLAVSGLEATIKVDQRYRGKVEGLKPDLNVPGFTGCRLTIQGLEETVVRVDNFHAVSVNQKQV